MHISPISLKTKEKSLLDFRKKIAEVFRRQTDETKNLIDQIIDYYENIIFCMPGNVYWMDKTCRTMGCNKNVLNMFGLKKPEQFYGLSFQQMAKIGGWSKGQGESFEHDTINVIKSALPKSDIEEPPIPGPDGKNIHFLTTRVPLFNVDGDVIGIVGISTDISKRKKMEVALKEAKEQAEAANRVKSEFLANITHDIRTPLSSLVALNDYLQNHIQDKSMQKLASNAYQCAEQLMYLLDEVLEISEIELGTLPDQSKTFDLLVLVNKVINLLRLTVEQKQLILLTQIDQSIPPLLTGKSQLLHRVLLNLISNAIKFTNKGQIKLTIETIHQDKQQVQLRIAVSDTGIGIPENKLEQIYTPFERLTAAHDGQYQGRGLGLHIVKKFIAALQGQITVRSKVNKGTTFTLTLPFQIASKSQIAYYRQKQNDLSDEDYLFKNSHIHNRSFTILLVEDTPVAQTVSYMAFDGIDCQIDLAKTGYEAVAKAKQKRYDLIFMDLGLSDISGIKATQLIRQSEKTHNSSAVPIVALTAHASQDDQRACLAAGMQQVIHKPLTVKIARKILAFYSSHDSDTAN